MEDQGDPGGSTQPNALHYGPGDSDRGLKQKVWLDHQSRGLLQAGKGLGLCRIRRTDGSLYALSPLHGPLVKQKQGKPLSEPN